MSLPPIKESLLAIQQSNPQCSSLSVDTGYTEFQTQLHNGCANPTPSVNQKCEWVFSCDPGSTTNKSSHTMYCENAILENPSICDADSDFKQQCTTQCVEEAGKNRKPGPPPGSHLHRHQQHLPHPHPHPHHHSSHSSVSDDPLVNSIKKLQNNEKHLYEQLDRNSSSQSPSLENQTNIIRQINENASIRSTLYNQFIDSAASAGAGADNLKKKHKELDITKAYLDNMRSRHDGLIRMAEINTYYTKQYDAQANIMKSVVYICLPILLVSVLRHYELIPFNIARIIFAITVVLGLVVLMYKLQDMARRDNRYYDQYDFPFDDNDVYTSSPANSSQPTLNNMEMQCIGQECCPEGNTHNAIWNVDLGQCVYVQGGADIDAS
jgi:hypothetical protein